jgi:hypothetical protein
VLRGDIPLLLFSSPYHVPHFPLLLLIFFRFFYIAPGDPYAITFPPNLVTHLSWTGFFTNATCRKKVEMGLLLSASGRASDRLR